MSSARVQNDKWYYKAGATYAVRTASAFAAKALPEDCIFSHISQSWFSNDNDFLKKSIVYFLARVPQAYLEIAVGGGDIATSGSAARRYTTKVVHSIPASVLGKLDYPNFENDCLTLFRMAAHDLSLDETSCFFSGISTDGAGNIKQLAHKLSFDRHMLVSEALMASFRVDQAVTRAWGLTSEETAFVRAEVGAHPVEYTERPSQEEVVRLAVMDISSLVRLGVEVDGASRWLTKKSYFVDRHTELVSHILRCSPSELTDNFAEASADVKNTAQMLISYAVGVAFGRWIAGDIERSCLEDFARNPFKKLPDVSPATNKADFTTPIIESDQTPQSPLAVAVEGALLRMWPEHESTLEHDIIEALGSSLGSYLDSSFFKDHLSGYSKSRRAAPVYWPLSTASGGYTLWVYYPSVTSQTLYTAINDFLEPRLKDLPKQIAALRDKGDARTRDETRALEALQELEQELTELRDTLLRIAPNYQPSQDDGVQITAAPLWPLFRHKPWQKVLKDTWDELQNGDYDWAHLAMAYWPDRVREKCRTDQSIAIAHGLEDLYEPPPEDEGRPARRRRRT